MKSLVALGALSGLLLIQTSIAHAEIYKWKDANGNTHYSQTPPPDTKATDIQNDIQLSVGKSAKAKPAAAEGQAAKADDGSADPELDKARAEGQENQAKYREFCTQQRSALSQLLANPLIRWKSETGAEQLLTAKERAEKIEQFEKTVKDLCSKDMSGPPPSAQ